MRDLQGLLTRLLCQCLTSSNSRPPVRDHHMVHASKPTKDVGIVQANTIDAPDLTYDWHCMHARQAADAPDQTHEWHCGHTRQTATTKLRNIHVFFFAWAGRQRTHGSLPGPLGRCLAAEYAAA